jgi:hypothetical protein
MTPTKGPRRRVRHAHLIALCVAPQTRPTPVAQAWPRNRSNLHGDSAPRDAAHHWNKEDQEPGSRVLDQTQHCATRRHMTGRGEASSRAAVTVGRSSRGSLMPKARWTGGAAATIKRRSAATGPGALAGRKGYGIGHHW